MSDEQDKPEQPPEVPEEETPPVNEHGLLLIPCVSVPPVIKSSNGHAWRLDKTILSYHLSAWIIFAPNYSRNYNFYYAEITVLSRREDREIKMKGATHEFVLVSLHPRQALCINLFPVAEERLFSGQFYSVTDDKAKECASDTICEICSGELNPVSKDKEQLIMRFGGSCLEDSIKDYNSIGVSDNEIN